MTNICTKVTVRKRPIKNEMCIRDSSYTKGLGVFMVKPCGYQITKGDYSDNIRMNEKDKLLFMFQKSMSLK